MKSKSGEKRINKRLLRLLERRQNEKVAKLKKSGYLSLVFAGQAGLLLLFAVGFTQPIFCQQPGARMTVRVKDLADITDVRSNRLIITQSASSF